MGVYPLTCPVELAIFSFPWGRYLGPEAIEQGVDVHVSSWRRYAPATAAPLGKIGGQYVTNQFVAVEARQLGFSEGIALTTDGFLSEGSGENLFLVRDGVLYTAPTAFSILPGITRDSVIRLARDHGYRVENERAMPREALYIADKLFFTGTAAEITPVRSVDRIQVGTGKRGPVTKRMPEAVLRNRRRASATRPARLVDPSASAWRRSGAGALRTARATASDDRGQAARHGTIRGSES